MKWLKCFWEYLNRYLKQYINVNRHSAFCTWKFQYSVLQTLLSQYIKSVEVWYPALIIFSVSFISLHEGFNAVSKLSPVCAPNVLLLHLSHRPKPQFFWEINMEGNLWKTRVSSTFRTAVSIVLDVYFQQKEWLPLAHSKPSSHCQK